MRRKSVPGEKPLYWVKSSKRDLLAMPQDVVRHLGTALGAAQYGGKHPHAKRWKGLGPGVFEIVSDFRTDTFRAAHVVHCLQKKSPSGRSTTRMDVELIASRLKAAQEDYEERYGQGNQES